MKLTRNIRGFTLIEMLVVISIIGLLAALTVPALNSIKRADATVAATRQLLDDVGRARQLAISHHTTVYMVFAPARFWTDPGFTSLPLAPKNLQDPGTNLYNKQLTGYNFVTLRSVGEQPGRNSPEYLGSWHTMPENTFIALSKFGPRNSVVRYTDPGTSRYYDVYGFEWLNTIPFPTEDAYAPGRTFASLPCIAFNYLGQLVSGKDEYLPVARGTVAHARNPATRTPIAAPPDVVEKPPGNSTNSFNLIHIDWLTGRARLEHQQISGS